MSIKKALMPIGMIILTLGLVVAPGLAFASPRNDGGYRSGYHNRGYHRGGGLFRGGNDLLGTLGTAALLGGLFGGGYGYGYGGAYANPYLYGGSYPYASGAAYTNPYLYGGAYANPYLYGGGLNLNGGFNYPGVF